MRPVALLSIVVFTTASVDRCSNINMSFGCGIPDAIQIIRYYASIRLLPSKSVQLRKLTNHYVDPFHSATNTVRHHGQDPVGLCSYAPRGGHQ